MVISRLKILVTYSSRSRWCDVHLSYDSANYEIHTVNKDKEDATPQNEAMFCEEKPQNYKTANSEDLVPENENRTPNLISLFTMTDLRL